MQILHRLFNSGDHDHVEFTRATWEQAMSDPSIAGRWTHDPNDCHDPAERLRARLAEEGGVEPVQATRIAAPPLPQFYKLDPSRGPTEWPPEVPLTPKSMSDFTGMSVEDCRDILEPHKRSKPIEDVTPMDGDGNPMLF